MSKILKEMNISKLFLNTESQFMILIVDFEMAISVWAKLGILNQTYPVVFQSKKFARFEI